MSLNLSCFAISTVASSLTLYNVCSKFLLPVYFPVFTSIAVNASVLSIVIKPPHFSHILRLHIFSICFFISYMSKTSLFSKLIFVLESSSVLFFSIINLSYSALLFVTIF